MCATDRKVVFTGERREQKTAGYSSFPREGKSFSLTKGEGERQGMRRGGERMWENKIVRDYR